METHSLRTLLVVHIGGLGDVLLAVPALRALRSAFPAHELGLLAGTDVGGLLKTCGVVDTLFPLEQSFTGLLAGPERISLQLHDWLSRCDVAVAWVRDLDGALRGTFTSFGVKQIIVQSASAAPAASDDGEELPHQADRLLDSVKGLTGGDQAAAILSLPSSVMAEGATILARNGLRDGRPLVGIQPGSGSRHKCCPPELLVELLQGLETEGYVPLLFEGPTDGDIVRRLLAICPRSPCLVQNVRLQSVAGVLAHLQLFIGHDSGLSHLSALLGLPTVTLFGPTDPRRWAPRGPHTRIITGATCQCETWSHVQVCQEHPCLRMTAGAVLDACRQARAARCGPSPLPSPCSAEAVVLESPATFSLN
jgi:ADP-heptose:LPS heptosyltransferase